MGNVPNAGIEPPNTSSPPKMSEIDQSDDLELLQNNYWRAFNILRFRSKPDLDPQSSIFNRWRRARALFPSRTLYRNITKGHRQSEIDKNRLSRSSRVRRPSRTCLRIITRGTPYMKIGKKMALDVSATAISARIVWGMSLTRE